MNTTVACDPVVELRRRLYGARNPDGGWPYYLGKASRLEPTGWAALALAESDSTPPDLVRFLLARIRPDGLLADTAGVNFASNALALLSLAGSAESAAIRKRAMTAVLYSRGVKLPPATQYYQNNRLQAWSWVPGAFSWVEPTAWTLLALKQGAAALDRSAADLCRRRIAEAERLLINRACAGGGWNYGNANMYGRELHAHVPTTAIALLAMQDRPEEAAVRRGLDCLSERRLSERTGMALALTSITMRVFGRACGDVDEALRDWTRRSGAAEHVLVTAMVACALAGHQHGVNAFRV